MIVGPHSLPAMDISASPVLISNLEVLELLKQRLEENAKHMKHRTRHRDFVAQKVHDYLQESPCTRLDSSRREELLNLLQSRKKQQTSFGNGESTGYGLMPAEALQVINFMPTEQVELYLLIEELHERMTDQDQEELLALLESYRLSSNGEAAAPLKEEPS